MSAVLRLGLVRTGARLNAFGGPRGRRWVSASASALPIPAAPAPPPPEAFEIAGPALNKLGEPLFSELGLGGKWPSGWAQSLLEFFHVTFELEWWGAIVLGTVCVRIAVLPAVIMAQRNNAKMANNMPRMTFLQSKISEAKQTGDNINAARYGQEMMLFMKKEKINPLKNALVPMAQFPFFISFFVGLRGMANCPVESMTNGGIFWFADLTVPDQFYLLPVLTSLTMLATIELGIDGSKPGRMKLAKYVVRALPFIMLPFTINFPSAILCYWLSSNTIALFQASILKIPAVRLYLKIPALVKHAPDAAPSKNLGFIGSIKDQFRTMKITKEVENRSRQDEISFNKAGKGPLIKTYKYDPTKSVIARAKQS